MLLLEVLKDKGMALVGRFVLRGRENLCLVRASDGALVLEELYFAEDVRAADETRQAVDGVEVNDDELAVALRALLSAADAPELTTVTGKLKIQSNNSLATLNLVKLATSEQVGAGGMVWVKCLAKGEFDSSAKKFYTKEQFAVWAEAFGAKEGDLLCVFDPDVTWVVSGRGMASRSANTPYEGWTLRGRVRHTLCAGVPVVVDGEACR